MKIHVLSDLHCEFAKFEPPQTEADAVVLAGDIQVGNKTIGTIAEMFPSKPVIYVPGNHEFYNSQRLETLRSLEFAAKTYRNIHFLENSEVVLQGVRFLGCTLWTDFLLYGEESRPWDMMVGAAHLQDFKLIYEGMLPLTPGATVGLHLESVAWLKSKLDEPFDGKTVVVTHHLPSYKSVASRYMGDPLSACFASHLDHLFDGSKAALWIHGHTHDNFDYQVNGTRVVCNPRGYVTYYGSENFDFDPGLVVEV